MDIGTEQHEVIVEPLELPEPLRPTPEPEHPAPAPTPARELEPVG